MADSLYERMVGRRYLAVPWIRTFGTTRARRGKGRKALGSCAPNCVLLIAQVTTPYVHLLLGLPVITPAMLPRPDPDPARQSAEEWFKLFKEIAGGLVQLYCKVGQELLEKGRL